MANYTEGPYLSFPKGATRSATFRQLQDACAAAQAILGDGYLLQPEAITNGGFCFVDWPGKRVDAYKSVRFDFENWPWLRDGVVDGDANYIAEVAASTFGPVWGNQIPTLLKAFYGAPVFTTTELQAVMSSLASCYQGCRIVKMPSNRALQRDFNKNKTSPSLCDYRYRPPR